MLLGAIFEPFVEKRPVCVMARGVLERLFDSERINRLFEKNAENGYTRDLLFSSLVRVMADVVLGVQPSVHAAFQAAEEDLPVSLTAFYNKLDRVETCVSSALVQDSAETAAPVVDALHSALAPWLPGYRCRVLDGNLLSATEHRIDELRTTWAAPLPGRALVVLDAERMLAERVFLNEDSYAQERTLIDQVLSVVQSGELWIADSNFATIKFFAGIIQQEAHFLFRQHGSIKGHLLGRRRKLGRCDTGVVYEQEIHLSVPDEEEPLQLRRITVKLDSPTRNGDAEIHLLSNVPVEDADPICLAELYRKRWTIEMVFHEMAQTLEAEINTLGYPKAALFAFCLALVAYNALSLLKSSLRAAHGEEATKQISGYYLSLEIRGTYDGMMIAVPANRWRVFRTLPPSQLAKLLKQLAKRVSLHRYRKHPRSAKKPPPRKSAYQNGAHVSTHRLLQKRTN
jgi:IS4 transposase